MASIDREREANTSFEEIAGVMRYNPKTGEFRRKDRPNAKVGSFNQKGRLRITVNGKKFLASRLAWLLYYGEWPAQTVDQYSSLLPPVGVWSVSQYQCGGSPSQAP